MKSALMPNLQYPNDPVFFRNLVLQRTDALTRHVGFNPLKAWLDQGDSSAIEAYFFNQEIRGKVYADLERDYLRDVDHVVGFLPNRASCRHVVSIGPGNGVLEVMLMKTVEPYARITLIDIENSESHHHGYAQKGSGYANLTTTKTFMIANGIAEENITLCNPRFERVPHDEFDLLISILSMGFHYPCDDYASFLESSCAPEGRIIIDKRKSVEDRGFERLTRSGFRISQTIDFGKFNRISISRNALTAR